jgi:putative hydrolase of the HAD superfamily
VSRWQAVVFDLDDTLYLEKSFAFSGFRAVSAWAETHLGIPAAQGLAEMKGLFEQGVRGDTFDRWLSGHGLSADSLVSQLVHVYRAHEPVLAPFPEVPEVLASLQGRYRLGLLSDGHLDVQRRKLAALGVAHYFDTVVFSDEWGREAWKPSAVPFEAVLRQLGTGAGESIYVGDNPVKDFFGARQVGMFSVQVRRPGGEYADLEPPTAQHAPHRIATSLVELEQVLCDR